MVTNEKTYCYKRKTERWLSSCERRGSTDYTLFVAPCMFSFAIRFAAHEENL